MQRVGIRNYYFDLFKPFICVFQFSTKTRPLARWNLALRGIKLHKREKSSDGKYIKEHCLVFFSTDGYQRRADFWRRDSAPAFLKSANLLCKVRTWEWKPVGYQWTSSTFRRIRAEFPEDNNMFTYQIHKLPRLQDVYGGGNICQMAWMKTDSPMLQLIDVNRLICKPVSCKA